MDIVEAKEISKIYRTLYGRVVALKKVNLKLQKGITGIVGPNGSGKTTLLKIILGIAKPTTGNILVLGKNPIEGEVKKRISYLPEKPVFPKNVTVRQLTKYISEMKEIPMEDIVDILNYLEIYDLDRKVGALSAGMTQKIGIAYALTTNQELIILDEPTANLDPVWRKRVFDRIKRKGKESSIIFTTHLLHDVEKIADEIVIMNEGEILLHDSMENIMKKYGNLHYEVTLKNGKVLTTDSLKEYLREDVRGIKVKKMELEEIFEVILNDYIKTN